MSLHPLQSIVTSSCNTLTTICQSKAPAELIVRNGGIAAIIEAVNDETVNSDEGLLVQLVGIVLALLDYQTLCLDVAESGECV